MDNERLKKQMDFILEMDKMKSIMRQTYLANYPHVARHRRSGILYFLVEIWRAF